MRGLFVTGTDTGVGKTVLSASLLASIADAGEPVAACKPVLTGTEEPPGEWPADDALLAAASGGDPAEVTALRFAVAASPHLAARLADTRIDPRQLLAAARGAGASGRTVVVEGVGGLLVPLCGEYSVCDLALALALPVVIAAPPGLGTINHTLLTLTVARARGLDVRAVVLTPWPGEPDVIELDNRATIGSLGAVEVATLPAVPSPHDADPETFLGQLAAAGRELPWQRWIGGA